MNYIPGKFDLEELIMWFDTKHILVEDPEDIYNKKYYDIALQYSYKWSLGNSRQNVRDRIMQNIELSKQKDRLDKRRVDTIYSTLQVQRRARELRGWSI